MKELSFEQVKQLWEQEILDFNFSFDAFGERFDDLSRVSIGLNWDGQAVVYYDWEPVFEGSWFGNLEEIGLHQY